MPQKHRAVYDQAKEDDTFKKKPVPLLKRPSEFTSSDKKKQRTISSYGQKPIDSATKKLYDTAVLTFIVADGRPFDSADGNGFKNLCSVLTDEAYKHPHPTTLSRKLNDMTAILQQSFAETIKTEIGDGRPSITFDHWKADNETNYLVLTHTHTHLKAICPGLPGWAGTRKVKPT